MEDKNTNLDEIKFSKAQLLSSKKYISKKDIIQSILKDNEVYSFTDVDDLIKKFLKGKVN